MFGRGSLLIPQADRVWSNLKTLTWKQDLTLERMALVMLMVAMPVYF